MSTKIMHRVRKEMGWGGCWGVWWYRKRVNKGGIREKMNQRREGVRRENVRQVREGTPK